MATSSDFIVDILSDIHLENVSKEINGPGPSPGAEGSPSGGIKLSSFLPCTSPVLILAGDVTRVYDMYQLFVSFIAVACDRYETVYYVAGNHEFYNNKGVSMTDIGEQIKKLGKTHHNFHFLERQHIILPQYKVVLYGATLWSEMPSIATELVKSIPVFISDKKQIDVDGWNGLHQESLRELEKAIKVAKGEGFRLIVVTHYAPLVKEVLHPKYHGSIKNVLYCTDLSHYLPHVATWVYAHTGSNCDLMAPVGAETRIISNQYRANCFRKCRFVL